MLHISVSLLEQGLRVLELPILFISNKFLTWFWRLVRESEEDYEEGIWMELILTWEDHGFIAILELILYINLSISMV